jgi:hypothetical protein
MRRRCFTPKRASRPIGTSAPPLVSGLLEPIAQHRTTSECVRKSVSAIYWLLHTLDCRVRQDRSITSNRTSAIASTGCRSSSEGPSEAVGYLGHQGKTPDRPPYAGAGAPQSRHRYAVLPLFVAPPAYQSPVIADPPMLAHHKASHHTNSALTSCPHLAMVSKTPRTNSGAVPKLDPLKSGADAVTWKVDGVLTINKDGRKVTRPGRGSNLNPVGFAGRYVTHYFPYGYTILS